MGLRPLNTVGQSKFWDSTAIFIQWDDWGGFYDPVPAPYEDYDGNGFRVPLLVISPYAKKNHVSHVQYETASVLRFAEDLYGLPTMAAADGRATSPAADCFDFTQNPRPSWRLRPRTPPNFLSTISSTATTSHPTTSNFVARHLTQTPSLY